MEPVAIAFLGFTVLSFGLGVYALSLRTRAPGEQRRVAQLAAVQLLEPLLSLGLAAGLRWLTGPPFHLFEYQWAALGFGLVLLQLTPLRFRSWINEDSREMNEAMMRFGLWRAGLSAILIIFVLWSGDGWFADSGPEAENISLLAQIVPVIALVCFLAGVGVFLFALAELYHIVIRVWEATLPSSAREMEQTQES